jgi:hypothetical protein
MTLRERGRQFGTPTSRSLFITNGVRPRSVDRAVPVSRQELAMPPSISLEQMTGFSLFMLKAVLSGRGDEIIDLAKVNLFH